MVDQSALKRSYVEQLRTGRSPRRIDTAGMSMRPLIKDGSTLTYIPCAADRRMVSGDIALFERSGRLIAHRIVGSFYRHGCHWYLEKGDNALAVGFFRESALIGRVVTIEYEGCICDLTSVRWRIASRAAGLYWRALYALVRTLQGIKRSVFGASASFPRAGSVVRKAVHFLSRIPFGKC